ncbi:MAG: PTS sugar transporter subunit IIC [Lachnospiraceae bacterium]|nr:PTS sugar transporter subunit IIC [Lachnospiraceae bacterium]
MRYGGPVLLPVFVIITLTSIFGELFHLATGSYINEFIYDIIQAPLSAIVQTTPGIIIMALACQLFWFLGIHGGLVVEPIRSPLSAAALAANIAAVEAGQAATQPLTRGLWTVFIVVGGAGLTLSLIFAILMFSKREEHRAIAKLSLFPGICGIGEPMVFGLPLVLNPVFAVPFILNSGIAAAIALGAIKIGFISCSTVDAPFGLPLFINAALSYGWRGAIVQLVILVVGTLIWIPFVLMSNRMAEKETAK